MYRFLPRNKFFIPLSYAFSFPSFHKLIPLLSFSYSTSSSPTNSSGLDITPKAIKQLLKIYEKDQNSQQALRVLVDMGGCHGFQYKLDLVDLKTKDPVKDILIEKEGAKVLIDTISLDLIRNAKLDFTDELIAQCFQLIDIPKATTHCGCGTSFELKE